MDAQRIVDAQPSLSGDLAGEGRLDERSPEVAHLVELWRARGPHLAGRETAATFVTRVYRLARKRAHEDARREEIANGQRLRDRIAAGNSVPADIDEVIRTVRELGEVGLRVPGPRAVQIADELVRLRAAAVDVLDAIDRVPAGSRAPAVVDVERAARALRALLPGGSS